MEVGSHLQNDMVPHDTVSATLDVWLPGAGIAVWDWIPLLLHEASTSEYFSLHIIVQLSGSQSKAHVFQVILPTRVKAHVSAFAEALKKLHALLFPAVTCCLCTCKTQRCRSARRKAWSTIPLPYHKKPRQRSPMWSAGHTNWRGCMPASLLISRDQSRVGGP
jgi:hypothetical protein